MDIRPHAFIGALAVLTALSGCGEPQGVPKPDTPTASSANGAERAFEAPRPTNAAAAALDKTAPKPQSTENVPAARAAAHYRPLDECAALPGFAAFRAQLADAVAGRDAATLALLAASDVTLDYGGGHGRDELVRRLSGDAGAALWADLATILTLGCDTRDGLVVLPWFFWNVPESLDPADAMLATGPAIPLLARPSSKAEKLATLDWEMVRLLPGFDPAHRFTHVAAEEELRGYVETRALRSVLGRRVIAEARDGHWQMTALVAGD